MRIPIVNATHVILHSADDKILLAQVFQNMKYEIYDDVINSLCSYHVEKHDEMITARINSVTNIIGTLNSILVAEECKATNRNAHVQKKCEKHPALCI